MSVAQSSKPLTSLRKTLAGLALLSIMACESPPEPAAPEFTGTYTHLSPDSSQTLLHRFHGDSVSTEKRVGASGCTLSRTEGNFTWTADSLCFKKSSLWSRPSCEDAIPDWTRFNDICFSVRNVKPDGYEALNQSGDPALPENWVDFKRRN